VTILTLIDNYFPLVGGAEKQAAALASRFQSHGHEVMVVTERKDPAWKAREVVDGVPVYRISYPKLRLIGAVVLFVRLAAYLVANRRSYDVIHVHIVKYFAFIASVIGPMLGKRVVVKFSGWEELDRGILNDTVRARPVYRLISWGVKRADCFVAISSEIEAALVRCGFPAERITRLPNGVDTSRFGSGADKASTRKALGMRDDATIAIFVGRLVNEKGLGYLLDAWADVSAIHPEAILYIIGDGYLAGELHSKVDELGIGKFVVFTGEVSNVHEYMRASDLFVLPSLSEGLSNTLLEAMATGLPVVGTKISGNTDLIDDGVNGIVVEPGDSGWLASALKTMVGDAAVRERMGEASRVMIDRGYSLEHVATTYERIFAGERGAA